MRILILSNFYPPHSLGGMEQLCQEVVDTLRSRGHQCDVLTSRFGAEPDALPEVGVVRALHLEAGVYHYDIRDFLIARSAQEKVNRRVVEDAIHGFCPDAVLVWGMWNLSRSIPSHAEILCPGRVAYYIADYWPMQPTVHEAYWRRPATRVSTRLLLAPVRRYAVRVLAQGRALHTPVMKQVACVSNYVRTKLIDAGALSDAEVIYNGIDPEPFLEAGTRRNVASGALRLVYTGSLLPDKGIHTAIEALDIVQRRGQVDGIHLDIVGGGHPDYEADLRNRVSAAGLGSHVTFHGRVSRSEIPGMLAACDVFLFTSIYEEPIARSVMEAMASGLAVIGAAVGGQAELLTNGVNSLVFWAGDAVQLAEAILQLRYNLELRKCLAVEGQNTVLSRFTLDRMVDEFETWLEVIVR